MQADRQPVPLASLRLRTHDWLKNCPRVDVVTNQYVTQLNPRLKYFRIYQIQTEPQTNPDSHHIFSQALRNLPQTIKNLFTDDFYGRRENVIWCISPKDIQAEVGHSSAKYQLQINDTNYLISLKLVKKSTLSFKNGNLILNQNQEDPKPLCQAISVFLKSKIQQNCKNIKEYPRNMFSLKNWGNIYYEDGFATRIGFKFSIEYICLTLYAKINKKMLGLNSKTVLSKLRQIGSNEKKCLREVLNQRVRTLYGTERSYSVKKIEWEMNPSSTFVRNEQEISFYDYYKTHYNEELEMGQPMILVESLKKERICIKKEKMVKLKNDTFIPAQLLAFIHVPTSLKNKHKRQTINELTPNKYVQGAYKFISQINSKNSEYFKIEQFNRIADARLLDQPQIVLSPISKLYPEVESGKFCVQRLSKEMVKLNVVFVYSVKNYEHDRSQMEEQSSLFDESAKRFCLQFTYTEYVEVKFQEGLEGWIQAIDDFLNQNGFVPQKQTPQKLQTQYFFIVALRKDEQSIYLPLKTYLSYNLQLYSQFYYRSNLLPESKPKPKVYMMLKQIYTKNNQSPWSINTTMTKKYNILLIGLSIQPFYDQFQLTLVRNIDIHLSNFKTDIWYLDTHQIPEARLQNLVQKSLKQFAAYQKGQHPDLVVVYRMGLNNQRYAASHIQNQVSTFKKLFKTGLIYVQVKSKPSQKMWIYQNQGHQQGSLLRKITNPQVGTVMRGENDQEFYLVAAKPNQNQGGTAHPVFYRVASNTSEIQMKEIANFTYQLSFGYPNWQGSVRLPQVLQLAKKVSMFPKPDDESIKHLEFETLSYL